MSTSSGSGDENEVVASTSDVIAVASNEDVDDVTAADEEAYLNSPWNVIDEDAEKDAKEADSADQNTSSGEEIQQSNKVDNKGTVNEVEEDAELADEAPCEAEETKNEVPCEIEETKDESPREVKEINDETQSTVGAATTADEGIDNNEEGNNAEAVNESNRRSKSDKMKDEALSTMAAAAAIALDEVGYSHGRKIVDDDDKDWDNSARRSSSSQHRSVAPTAAPSVPAAAAMAGATEVPSNAPVAAAAVAAMLASAQSSLELGRPVAAKAPIITHAQINEQEDTSRKEASEKAQEGASGTQKEESDKSGGDEATQQAMPASSILAAATDAAIEGLSVPTTPHQSPSSKPEEKRSTSPGRTLAEIQAEKERPSPQQETLVVNPAEADAAATVSGTNTNGVPTDTLTGASTGTPEGPSAGVLSPSVPKAPMSSFDPLAPTSPALQTEGSTSLPSGATQPMSTMQGSSLASATQPLPGQAVTEAKNSLPSSSDASPESSVVMAKADYHPLTNSDTSATEKELPPEDDDLPQIAPSASESSAERGPMWQRAKELAEEEQLIRIEEEEVEAEMQRLRRERRGLPAHISMTITNEGNSVCARSVSSDVGSKKTQLSQSLMAKTRSCADVDSVVPTRNNIPPVAKRPPGVQGSLLRAAVDAESTMPGAASPQSKLNSGLNSGASRPMNDPSVFLQPNVARKRVKVVQLLVFGLLGIIAGFFGSVYVQFTCYFVSTTVKVGGNEQEFELHLGLWKYSPIDSVFEGYTYCYQYDEDEWSNRPPAVSKICGMISVVSGTIALAVLWTYLIMGSTRAILWKMAVRLLLLAGICQSFTFVFYLSDTCRQRGCTIGPGAGVSIIVTIVWFVVAYEMHHNSPLSAILRSMLGVEQNDPFSKVKRWWDGLPINDSAKQEKVRENVVEGFAKVNPLQAAVTPGGFRNVPRTTKRQVKEEHYYDGDSISALDSFTDGGTAYEEYEDEKDGWTEVKSAVGWKKKQTPAVPPETSLAKLAQKRASQSQSIDVESARHGSRSGSRPRDRGGSYRPPPIDYIA